MSTGPVYAYLRDAKGVCRAACLFEEVTVEIENKSTESLMPPEVHLIYAWVVLNPLDQDYRPEAKDRLQKRFNRAKNRAIHGHRNFGRDFKKYKGDVMKGSCIVQKLESLGLQKIGWSISSGYFSGRLLLMREFVAVLGSSGRKVVLEGNPAGLSILRDAHRDHGFRTADELSGDVIAKRQSTFCDRDAPKLEEPASGLGNSDIVDPAVVKAHVALGRKAIAGLGNDEACDPATVGETGGDGD